MINYECIIWGKEWIWKNKMTDLVETKGLSKIR